MTSIPAVLQNQTTRRSTIQPYGSRTSSAGPGAGRKRSSIYGQGGSQVKKDNRPLSDKSYQTTAIKKLILFLAEHGYQQVVTHKSLQLPSAKEFTNIFNFLLSLIDKDLSIPEGAKIAEEVPKILKTLGYPFTISHNHLINLGSPHAWPIVLGSVTWLTELCSVSHDPSTILFIREDGFEESADKQEYELESYSYQQFMMYGPESEEYTEVTRKREERFRRICETLQEEQKVVESKNCELEAAIVILTESSIPVLQNRIEENEKQHGSLSSLIEGYLLPNNKKLEQESAEVEEANSHLEVQIDATIEKVKQLEELVRSQPISAKEAQAILQKREETQLEISKQKQLYESNLQKLSELQMEHNKIVAVIDKDCQSIQDKLRRLSAILPDAARLAPPNYNISNRSDPEAMLQLMKHSRELKQAIRALQNNLASEMAQIETMLINGEASESALHSEKVKKQLEIDNIRHRLDIEKDSLEKKKREREEVMKNEQIEKHNVERQVLMLQEGLGEIGAAEKQLAKVNVEVEAATGVLVVQMRQSCEGLQQHVAALLKYIQVLKDKRLKYKSDLEQIIASISTLKL